MKTKSDRALFGIAHTCDRHRRIECAKSNSHKHTHMHVSGVRWNRRGKTNEKNKNDKTRANKKILGLWPIFSNTCAQSSSKWSALGTTDVQFYVSFFLHIFRLHCPRVCVCVCVEAGAYSAIYYADWVRCWHTLTKHTAHIKFVLNERMDFGPYVYICMHAH